mgnify:CR=1 FL=1
MQQQEKLKQENKMKLKIIVIYKKLLKDNTNNMQKVMGFYNLGKH